MAAATYSYVISSSDNTTWDTLQVAETLTEIPPNDDDEYTFGEVLNSSFGDQVTYQGIDENGNPTFLDGSGNTVAYSNDPLDALIGEPVGIIDPSSLPLCFMAGTMVTTPEGSKAVEELTIDDTVITSSGEVSKVKFVGIQSMDKFTIPTNRLPVCIRQDALAPNVPNKDLYVSADHAMYVDGILSHASALVNGISICRVERSDLEQNFTYYSVELEDHSLILADNAPAETFVDNVTRAKFNNYKEYIELYGENENINLTGEIELPRAMSKRQLPKAIKDRLEKRALALFSDELSHTA